LFGRGAFPRHNSYQNGGLEVGFIVDSLIKVLLRKILDFVNPMLKILFDIVFDVEDFIKAETAIPLPELHRILFSVGISLIILKFLKKGFEIYVLWTDGDPDSDPLGYLMNFIKAIVTALCFPFIYRFFVDICREISDSLTSAVTLHYSDAQFFVASVPPSGGGVLIGLLVFFIIFIILFFSLAKRGIELLLLQAGFPLACVGLLDNDKGVFKSYFMLFVRAFITTIMQLLLIKLGLALVLSPTVSLGSNTMSLLLGIAAALLSLSTPRIMSEFLLPTAGGGGVGSKIYQTTFVASSVKRLFR
jgi:hypothetical protein